MTPCNTLIINEGGRAANISNGQLYKSGAVVFFACGRK